MGQPQATPPGVGPALPGPAPAPPAPDPKPAAGTADTTGRTTLAESVAARMAGLAQPGADRRTRQQRGKDPDAPAR